MAFCVQCGSPVDTPFCIKCGAANQAVTTTTTDKDEPGVRVNMNPDGTYGRPTAQPTQATIALRPDGFFRTPLQVLILGYATFGLYAIYWLIRGRRVAENELGLQPTPYGWYFFWLIPIVAIFSGAKSAGIIEDRVAKSGEPRSGIPFWALAVLFFIVDFLWRLPDPYWELSLFSPIFLAMMHVGLARAERREYPSYPWPKFSVWEWIISVLGIGVTALALYGGTLQVSPFQMQFTVGAIVVWLLSFAVFAFVKLA